jgi:simple sugar transport system permease protein
MKHSAQSIGKFLLQTKLFWGLAVLYLVGIVSSPVNRKGLNIFLEPGNQSDVLRQVSNNGIIAVGMTLVILTGGIDLSVGSMMALGSVVCAMLLTQQGWTNASMLAIPVLALVSFFLCAYLVPLIAIHATKGAGKSVEKASPAARWIGIGLGAILAVASILWTVAQIGPKFGVPGVLIAVPAVGLTFGAINGLFITKGRMQPFIVTLAMMVAILGIARLLGGSNTAVHPVYSGTNATEDFDILRALLFQILPVPGIFFLIAVLVFGFVLKVSTFGRYIYAIGGNEQAARLAGIQVDHLKIAVYAISGMLASTAGVLYTAQYRQGKPDAGEGAELDAIAAVVIGGTNLMGGRGSMLGTLVGVLIFGFLGNILQLRNIDSNTQLVLKGGIILAAVLLQEGQVGLFWRQIRTVFPTIGRVPAKRLDSPPVEEAGTRPQA